MTSNQKNERTGKSGGRARYAVLVGMMLLVSLSNFVSAQPNAEQMNLLTINCVQCHANPDTGAPIFGNTKDWEDPVRRGEEDVLVNVLNGVRGMPPLGYCSACTEEDFRILIRFMLGINDDGSIR